MLEVFGILEFAVGAGGLEDEFFAVEAFSVGFEFEGLEFEVLALEVAPFVLLGLEVLVLDTLGVGFLEAFWGVGLSSGFGVEGLEAEFGVVDLLVGFPFFPSGVLEDEIFEDSKNYII